MDLAIGVDLHVEGLDLLGPVLDEDGLLEMLVGEELLVLTGEIIAPRDGLEERRRRRGERERRRGEKRRAREEDARMREMKRSSGREGRRESEPFRSC